MHDLQKMVVDFIQLHSTLENNYNEHRAREVANERAIFRLCAYILVLIAVQLTLWTLGRHYEKRNKTNATTACFVAMPAAMALFFYLANKMLVYELSSRREDHYIPLV